MTTPDLTGFTGELYAEFRVAKKIPGPIHRVSRKIAVADVAPDGSLTFEVPGHCTVVAWRLVDAAGQPMAYVPVPHEQYVNPEGGTYTLGAPLVRVE